MFYIALTILNTPKKTVIRRVATNIRIRPNTEYSKTEGRNKIKQNIVNYDTINQAEYALLVTKA